jgi:hypothetical protein
MDINTILLVASIGQTIFSCPVHSNSSEMYDYYYSTTTLETGVDKDGTTTAVSKNISQDQFNIAWSCLIKAGALNNCKALYVLRLYYKHDILERYGIKTNIQLAEKYEYKFNKYCSHL